MIAEIERIRGSILPLAVECGVGTDEDDIVVEADQDTEGYDFLRVQLKLPRQPVPNDEQLLSLLEAIEETVSMIDDRTVSVRFDDPADG